MKFLGQLVILTMLVVGQYFGVVVLHCLRLSRQLLISTKGHNFAFTFRGTIEYDGLDT